MADGDASYTNALSTLSSSIQSITKLNGLANSMYVNGYPSIAGAANVVNSGNAIVQDITAIQSSVVSLATQMSLTYIVDLMDTAVVNAGLTQSSVNNLSNYLFSGY
jgi:hypothetical protein